MMRESRGWSPGASMNLSLIHINYEGRLATQLVSLVPSVEAETLTSWPKRLSGIAYGPLK